MSARRILVVFLAAALAAACRPDVEFDVPCGTEADLSCPTGWRCDVASGLCVAGESKPTVTFDELEPGSVIHGRVGLAVSIVSANGIDDVTLRAMDEGAVAITLSPKLTDGDGQLKATWSTAFETWMLDDGPTLLEATVSDTLGQVTTHVHEVVIANGAPLVQITSPGSGNTLIKPFKLEGAVSSRVPVTSVTAGFQGFVCNLSNEKYKWTDTDQLEGTFTGEITCSDLPNGAAVIEVRALDAAGIQGAAELDVVVGGT